MLTDVYSLPPSHVNGNRIQPRTFWIPIQHAKSNDLVVVCVLHQYSKGHRLDLTNATNIRARNNKNLCNDNQFIWRKEYSLISKCHVYELYFRQWIMSNTIYIQLNYLKKWFTMEKTLQQNYMHYKYCTNIH